jgi:hypothetical protein
MGSDLTGEMAKSQAFLFFKSSYEPSASALVVAAAAAAAVVAEDLLLLESLP